MSNSLPNSELNREISHHIDALQRLRALRNKKVSWTQQLPIGVLCDIFTIYRNDELYSPFIPWNPTSQSDVQKPAAIPWIIPSHVCQHWRTILLDHAAFWAVLLLNNVKWTEELLKRSKGAPLNVHRPLHSAPPAQPLGMRNPYWGSFRLALRERHRISQLNISLPELIHSLQEEAAMIKAFLRGPFPELKSLEIRSARLSNTTPPYPGPPHESEEFLRRINEWVPPQLSSLKISGVPLSAISLGSNLTRLEIVDRGRRAGEYSVNALLELLGRLPLLQHLILNCTLQNIVEGESMDRCLHPSLKYLTIESMNTPLLPITVLFQHLETPPNLNIVVTGCFFRGFYRSRSGLVTNVSENGLGERTEALDDAIRSFFFSLSPHLGLFDYSQSQKYKFRSMLVEVSSWSATIILSRNGRLDLVGCPPWDNSKDSPWIYSPRFEYADVQIEFQDISRLNRSPIHSGTTSESDRDRVTMDPTSFLMPFTSDFLQSSEHVFLSETRDYQSSLSIVPWVNALPSATRLKELELRVTEEALRPLQNILGSSESKGETSLSCLESIIFWECRFASITSSPKPPKLRLQPVNHQDQTC
ncbi:hypothetical protein DL96DRAFT_1491683 [Flagelloscypha sp. PMI_526]|nr:hypothetical protein DL96DRAFT_1491683 [Flagelloscypha sp. PMI_526]